MAKQVLTQGLKSTNYTSATAEVGGRIIRGAFIKVTKGIPPGYSTENVKLKNAQVYTTVLADENGNALAFQSRATANKFKKEKRL